MSLDIWLLYVATVLAFMLTPGPSHLLMLSNSMAYGFRRGVFTAVGDLSANALQMTAAGLGLSALLATTANGLLVIQWLGVAYLLYVGVQMFRKADITARGKAEKLTETKLRLKLWMRGFITSAANPKAVVFFAALFPQFIKTGEASGSLAVQLIVLGMTYLVIDGAFLCAYGFCADRITARLKATMQARIHKLGGVCVIAAALLLGMKSLAER